LIECTSQAGKRKSMENPQLALDIEILSMGQKKKPVPLHLHNSTQKNRAGITISTKKRAQHHNRPVLGTSSKATTTISASSNPQSSR
jgi:hypothetical protein